MRTANSNISLSKVDYHITSRLPQLEAIWKSYGAEELVITSTTGGGHGEHSLHYIGLAIDVRVWNLPNMNISKFRDFLSELYRNLLDNDFDVIIEWAPLHIHIEWDPK